MYYKESFDLGFVNFSFIFAVHSLEKLSNLEVTFALLCENSGMKLLNLTLNLLFNCYFNFEELGQCAENVVTLLLDVTCILSFDLI